MEIKDFCEMFLKKFEVLMAVDAFLHSVGCQYQCFTTVTVDDSYKNVFTFMFFHFIFYLNNVDILLDVSFLHHIIVSFSFISIFSLLYTFCQLSQLLLG